jgi:hypothetical protein
MASAPCEGNTPHAATSQVLACISSKQRWQESSRGQCALTQRAWGSGMGMTAVSRPVCTVVETVLKCLHCTAGDGRPEASDWC